MKKKILSFSLALIMLICAMVSMGGEAHAQNDPTVQMPTPYEEVFFDFSVDSRVQYVDFVVPYSGYYIIQIFGEDFCPDSGRTGVVRELTLLNTVNNTNVSAVADTGYGRSRFLNCYLDASMYRIDLWFSWECESARLSITYAEGLYLNPAYQYEDIFAYSPDSISFTFTYEMRHQAQVALVICSSSEEDTYRIEFVDGYGGIAYVLDPTSSGGSIGTWVSGSGQSHMYLEANIPYYVVVFLETGDGPAIPVEEITMVLQFTRV